jgi:hypothetical protein
MPTKNILKAALTSGLLTFVVFSRSARNCAPNLPDAEPGSNPTVSIEMQQETL